MQNRYFRYRLGTGGCISGVSSYMKQNKTLHTIAVEPIENNILSGGDKFSPHALQGIGPNFVPGNFKSQYIDEIFGVSKESAYATAKLLSVKAAISCGISSGANAFAAFETAKKHSNKTICFIACDFCERYVSCDLFD